jgi:chloride channel 3/4/5
MIGCDEWHRWSSIWPVNYFFYLVFSVRAPDVAAAINAE